MAGKKLQVVLHIPEEFNLTDAEREALKACVKTQLADTMKTRPKQAGADIRRLDVNVPIQGFSERSKAPATKKKPGSKTGGKNG